MLATTRAAGPFSRSTSGSTAAGRAGAKMPASRAGKVPAPVGGVGPGEGTAGRAGATGAADQDGEPADGEPADGEPADGAAVDGAAGTGGGVGGRRTGGRCGAGRGRLDVVRRGRQRTSGCLIVRGCTVAHRSPADVGRLVVLEELPPGRVDSVLVGEVLLVELVDEPLVGTELPRPEVLVGRVGGVRRHGGYRLIPKGRPVDSGTANSNRCHITDGAGERCAPAGHAHLPQGWGGQVMSRRRVSTAPKAPETRA